MRGVDVEEDAFELVVDVRCTLGEGPVWDARDRRLVWVDIERRAIHWYGPEDESSGAWPVEQRTGAIWPAARGGFVVADELGFARLEPPTMRRVAIDDVLAGSPGVRMNDGAVDPAGRFWAGSMADPADRAAGSLFRLDPDGSTRVVITPVTISNGIDWSPDGGTMYYTDTVTRRIDAYPFDGA